ncbi:hypothetical protein GGR92_004433 [Spirosoma lacussanchae]|uniref:AAA family ATPase n=1 Tax=Spirosoma lacussanchae TaxID=1884249 RepID=UPI001108EA65|nr:AAA family ATPase [Spirosoma lacussanchae]
MATENPRVWFKSISLENVRSFGAKQTIYFTSDGTKDGELAQWNVILGDNGTGKTTVLKGLCLDEKGVTVSPHWFMREHKDAKVGIGRSDGTNVYEYRFKLHINVHRDGLYTTVEDTHPIIEKGGDSHQKPYVFAYGAARRIGITGITEEQAGTTKSLFDENATLVNAEELLIIADYSDLKNESIGNNKYGLVSSIIKRLLGQEIAGITIVPNALNRFGPPKVYFQTHYGKVLLHELSLGYKTLIAWMVDFAKGLLDRYPDSPDPLAEPAVCLVDEIDLHLHPKFQRSIIKFLTETFPNTQFIVTAHSPLVVQSAQNANIVLLKREGDETHVAQGIDVHSWRIDQILSSDLFGEISSRPPATEERMQRRRALLLQDERTEQENQELARLEEELGTLTAAESQEALKALELISKSLTH